MGRVLNVAAILLVVLLALPRVASATLGMCTVTGTVYNVDGSPAALGTLSFRLPSTQTFNSDSVQTSLEPVTLDAGGNIPAGVQVPLGARIFIQVNRDKPVSVVVTNNALNCPIPFGNLYGAGAGGVPIPSTVITAINTVNDIPGVTDTAVNPAGAGPATLTLNDGLPVTWGSSSSLTDLSGAAAGSLFSVLGISGNPVFLQLANSATTAGTNMGQLTFGSPTTSAAEKRSGVIQVIAPTSGATDANGQMNFFLTDGTGTSMGSLGPTLELFPPTSNPIAQVIGTGNGPRSLLLQNLTAGTSSQAFFDAESDTGATFFGQRSSTWTGPDVPANNGFLETGATTSGLYLVDNSALGAEGIHFAANGEIAAGNLALTEDASADFFLTYPNVVQFTHNTTGAAAVENENPNSAGYAQFQVFNDTGQNARLGEIGSTYPGGAPYNPNTGWVDSSSSAGLLLYGVGGPLHLAADGQGGVGTLDLTEDGSANMFLTVPNPGHTLTIYNNGNDATNLYVDNPNTGGAAQGGVFVENAAGVAGGFSALGTGWTPGGPYLPNEAYVNGDQANGLLLYSAGTLHLGADSVVPTLDMTEDGSGDFQFEPNNSTGFQRFYGGGSSQPALVAQSTQNNTNDIFQVLPQNSTIGVGIWYNGIRAIGTSGNNAMYIDSQGSSAINFNAASPTTEYSQFFSGMGTVNNHHIYSALDSGTQPSISSCGGTGATIRTGSTDNSGNLAWSTSSGATNCLINFGAAWGSAPNCTCSAENQVGGVAVACGTNTSTTQLQLTFQGTFVAGSGQVNWNCIGISNDVSG